MLRSILLALSLVLLAGCSSRQAEQLGLGGGQVNGYAQQHRRMINKNVLFT